MVNKHHMKSDGWLLYSLSREYETISNIIGRGDMINHAIFNYDEVNDGLLRLIQNGLVEEEEGMFRISIKGEKMILNKTSRLKAM